MKNVILTAIAGALFTKSLLEDGSPKLDKNGEEFGFIRVQNPDTIDLSYAYSNGGKKAGHSALIAMTTKAWERSKDAYKAGMEIPGQVVVIESLEKTPGSQVKRAGSGDDAVVCTFKGQPIYRSTVFTSDQAAQSVLIAHDNTEEIKAAQAIAKEANAGAVLND